MRKRVARFDQDSFLDHLDEFETRTERRRTPYTSGYSENAMIEDGHLGGGEFLLAKPYRKVDLARMIRAALAG